MECKLFPINVSTSIHYSLQTTLLFLINSGIVISTGERTEQRLEPMTGKYDAEISHFIASFEIIFSTAELIETHSKGFTFALVYNQSQFTIKHLHF